jgi:hypothetical protein
MIRNSRNRRRKTLLVRSTNSSLPTKKQIKIAEYKFFAEINQYVPQKICTDFTSFTHEECRSGDKGGIHSIESSRFRYNEPHGQCCRQS